MARIYQTRAWHDQLSPSIEEFELLALEAYAHLPEEFRKLTGEVVIQIAEFPTDEIMDDLSLETPFDLLGLFEGRGIAERWTPAHRRRPQPRDALPPCGSRLLGRKRRDAGVDRKPRAHP